MNRLLLLLLLLLTPSVATGANVVQVILDDVSTFSLGTYRTAIDDTPLIPDAEEHRIFSDLLQRLLSGVP